MGDSLPSDPHVNRRAKLAQARAVKAAKVAERAGILATPPSLVSTPVQTKFIEAALSGEYKYCGFGGGIRGTKTWGGLQLFIILCKIFARSRWAVVRKDLPTLRRNTIPSFNKIKMTCRRFVGDINQSDWTATCANGSKLIFFAEGLSGDPELNRWRGLEVNGFLLEESNELAEQSWHKAIERAGSWIIPPDEEGNTAVQPMPLIACTFNPCDNWPRDVFYDPFMEERLKAPYFYQPATIADNPYASPEYQEGLKELPEREYNRFVLGDWSTSMEPNQLIPLADIRACVEVERVGVEQHEAVDVARFGDDETVFARTIGNALVELVGYNGLSITRTAKTAAERIALHSIDERQYRVDSVGVGAGVADNLREHYNLNVREFVAGAKAIDRRLDEAPREHKFDRSPKSVFKFANLRTQAWWEFAQMLRKGEVSIKQAMLHPRLVKDLLAMKYEIVGDKLIEVWSKEKLKDLNGRSTDYGDAVVMAYFKMPRRLTNTADPTLYKKVRR